MLYLCCVLFSRVVPVSSFFLNPLDSNTAIHYSNRRHTKIAVFEKKKQNINPRKILGKVTKFHEIWMSYEKVMKQNIRREGRGRFIPTRLIRVNNAKNKFWVIYSTLIFPSNNYEKIDIVKSIKQILDSQLQMQHFEQGRHYEESVKLPRPLWPRPLWLYSGFLLVWIISSVILAPYIKKYF